ncbi:hypothetical protein J31TS4_15830 [Paenibacillus sp. J31TS4]|uniref:hypothetical protein n=1 Tax=Paenibacillus sp. J31TS4 TaxID=2807195 RepID=UPI001B151762|nr:hypothetical protein [Paenibacillus sp. J31TS4]GIP38303.1 hypothetical protein J31TS4_15830 [Paenibacillus sp. J31TS4]
MPYNTKRLIESQGVVVPQVYNPAADQYEPVQGSAATGPRTILYSANGTPLMTDANPGAVKLTGSIVPKEQALPVYQTGGLTVFETIANAVSVPAKASYDFNINPTTEKEIWLAVSIDKQPWSLEGSAHPFYAGVDAGTAMYFPRKNNNAKTFGNASPSVSLHLGQRVSTSVDLIDPANMQEARLYKIPYDRGLKGRVTNYHATDTATVTVKILRVWG